MSGEQAASEYTGTAIRDMLRWTGTTVQEHWYYVVAAVVLLVLIWSYLRK